MVDLPQNPHELNEREHGSPWVVIAKFQEQIQSQSESLLKLTERIQKLEARIRLVDGKSSKALNEVSTVNHLVKKRRGGNLTGAISKMPGYQSWINHLMAAFAPLPQAPGMMILHKLFRAGEMITTGEIRQELAIKFGTHFLDMKIFSSKDIVTLCKACGFTPSVRREFITTKGLELHADIVLVKRKEQQRESEPS